MNVRQYLQNTCVGWQLKAHLFSFIFREERWQKQMLPEWIKRVADLLNRLPPEQACREISTIFVGVPAHAAGSLARRVADLIVQDKETLLYVADFLSYHEQVDEAQTLVWRGIRLYETDTDVWESAFKISLRSVLYSAPFPEWRRAYVRYKYLVANAPPQIRDHPSIAPYLLFSGEKTRHLSELPAICLLFWQSGMVERAREWLGRWWNALRTQNVVPDAALRVAVWYMLGLGMFAEAATDSLAREPLTDLVVIAKWFDGSPLPHPEKGSKAHALHMFIRWSEYLMERRRPPLSTVWRSLWLAQGQDQVFVSQMLLTATFGLHKHRRRRNFMCRLERSRVEWFLPYLHLLCIATARLGWGAETRFLWQRISAFDVAYPRKEELHRFLRQSLPTTELE